MDKKEMVIIQYGRKFYGGPATLPAKGLVNPRWTTSPNATRIRKADVVVIADYMAAGVGHCLLVLSARDVPTADSLFREYRDMAVRIAGRLSSRFAYVSDLEEQALSFLATLITENWGSYDGKRASVNTWVYNSIQWHLQKVAARARARRETGAPHENHPGESFAKPMDILAEGLGADAAFILETIRHDPDGMNERFRLPLHTLPFKEYLVTDHDWSWEQVNVAWAELTMAFGGSEQTKEQLSLYKRN